MKSLCVSLDTAKALKAAGWTKPTAFDWIEFPDGIQMIARHDTGRLIKHKVLAPALTAEEVLRELPEEIPQEQYLAVLRQRDEWSVQYSNENCENCESRENKSLSEAAAQMWLWCVSEGHIKTEVRP